MCRGTVVLLVMAPLSSAADIGSAALVSELQRCAALPAETRLACYDELAEAHASPEQTAARARKEFGLSAAQRTPATTLGNIEARVVSFGRSGSGRTTIRLDNGQVWELDSDDPMLAEQQAVVIKRAAMSSYLLTTQHKRIHRVRRIR
jgi:hypothetical protein